MLVVAGNPIEFDIYKTSVGPNFPVRFIREVNSLLGVVPGPIVFIGTYAHRKDISEIMSIVGGDRRFVVHYV